MTMVKSNTGGALAGTGFDCPTIGSTIPKGHKLVCGVDNRWRLVKTELVASSNVNRKQ